MSEPSEADTVEDMPILPPAAGLTGSVFEVDFDGLTDRGRVRPLNEDQFHIVQFGRYLWTVSSSLPSDEASQEFGGPGNGVAVAIYRRPAEPSVPPA